MAKARFETKTILSVPHKGRRVSFDSQVFGPTTYKRVGLGIDEAGLFRPTFGEIVSLIYSAAKSSDVYAQRVLDIFKNQDRAFCSFDNIRNSNNEALFVSDRNRDEVQFPIEFRIGEQSPEEFAENPMIRALCGDEKTKNKLAGIAKRFGLKPYVEKLNYLFNDSLDISMISTRDGRLCIGGSNFDYYDGLCSFGVLKVRGRN